MPINEAKGAPVGNQFAVKKKLWSDALRHQALRDPKRLSKIADKLLDMAADGDIAAIRELGDRLEGRPIQATELNANLTLTHEQAVTALFGLADADSRTDTTTH